VIDDHLNKSEPAKVSDFVKQKSITDCHHIEEAYKIVEAVRQRDEEVSLFRDLKEKGDGEEEGQDNDAT
jgi:hypothetical protein